MAKAKVNKSGGITLKLSVDEASFLYFLLGNTVTGDDLGPRGLSQSVWEAMDGEETGLVMDTLNYYSSIHPLDYINYVNEIKINYFFNRPVR